MADNTFSQDMEVNQVETEEGRPVEAHILEDADHLPSYDTVNITNISKIQELCSAYSAGFNTPDSSNEHHMQRAKLLVIAMLEHYYPKDQGFHVTPITFETMARFGWSFLMDKKKVVAAAKKDNLPIVRVDPAFDHPTVIKMWGTGQYYHRIAPGDITGFAVWSTLSCEEPDGTTIRKSVPHTFLGIIMDDLKTFDQWIPDDKLPRGKKSVTNARVELLSYSLGHHADIKDGYGIIMLGPRIEFYKYKQEPWAPKETEEQEEEEEEQYNPFSKLDEKDWCVDVREGGLADVDRLFRKVCEQDVRHWGGVTTSGSRSDARTDRWVRSQVWSET